MPRRLLHRRPMVIVASGLVAASASGVAAWSLHERAAALDRVLYEQCVANELQDSVIVAQLQAAKVRARATLPKDSQELYDQLQIINDGIATLEPPGEPDCKTPAGSGP